MLQVKKLTVISLTLGKSKTNLTATLPLEKSDAWATFWASYLCHQHSNLASQTYENLYQVWALLQLHLVAYFSRLFKYPVFGFSPFLKTIGEQHCAAPVWLTGCYVTPWVTRSFPPNTYLERQRISAEEASILSMYLCSHT